MRTRLTQKQERFCLEYFKIADGTRAAIVAGYSNKTARSIASINLTKENIQARLNELRKRAEDATVMNVLERKQRLSEIGRARVTDFTEADENGARIKVDLKSANSGALQEVTTEELKLGEGKAPVVHVTKLKLHNPIAAIQELNKMDGIYSDSPNITVPVKVEARIIHFDAKDVAKAILEAERLGIPPTLLGDDGHREDAAVLSSQTDAQAAPLPESEN